MSIYIYAWCIAAYMHTCTITLVGLHYIIHGHLRYSNIFCSEMCSSSVNVTRTCHGYAYTYTPKPTLPTKVDIDDEVSSSCPSIGQNLHSPGHLIRHVHPRYAIDGLLRVVLVDSNLDDTSTAEAGNIGPDHTVFVGRRRRRRL